MSLRPCARHVAKAKRLRASSDLAQGPGADQSLVPIEGSTREIVEAHIRDPRTPRRDVANLVNALARLTKDETPMPPDSPALLFRPGTLILEPGRRSSPGDERRFRLMLRKSGRIEHLSGRDYDLTAADALDLVLLYLAPELDLTREALVRGLENAASGAGQ